MTTRKFSATDLHHPRYSLELGRLSIRSKEQREQKQTADNGAATNGADEDDVNLSSTCLPRFSQLAQVIEVKKPGLTLPGRVSSNIKDFLGSYCVIENARPELFVRRDFISKFVDKGTIHVSHLSDHQGVTVGAATVVGTKQSTCGAIVGGYKLATSNNVMTITMNAKQYHRFGLLAKKVISLSTTGPRRKSKRSSKRADDLYIIEIHLRDERIKKNNKYQDRLVSALRRLTPINKVYFRFIPDKSKLELTTATADELSLEFFNHVIEEYALDGCQPVPLTKCTKDGQRVERNFVNYSQLHPELGLSKIAPRLGSLIGGNGDKACIEELEADRSDMALAQVLEIVDWLGYQVLRLDCDHLSQIFGWNDAVSAHTRLDRVDVSCTRIIGNIDFKHVQESLTSLFDPNNLEDLVLRALILYDGKHHQLQELRRRNISLDGDGPGAGSLSDGGAEIDSNNSGVIYLQDLSNGIEAAQEITVIGMSNAG